MAHEQIHSGHFMTSNPHTEEPNADDDEDIEVDVVEDDEKPEDITVGAGASNIKELEEKPVTFYKFGPKKTQSIAIDVSLNKLNKCIKVAYNKMTTPKWKDFKGLRLHWKQRIRLNNVIWRAYYIEFRKNIPGKLAKKKTPFCYFAVPDDDMTHQKIEGSLLEGMYWKRKMEAVCAQYKRWRMRSKQNIMHDKGHTHIHGQKRKREYPYCRSLNDEPTNSSGNILPLRFEGEPPTKAQRSQTPKNMSTDYFDDDFGNEFTDELFESLNQPYMFPNPREMMQSGNADIMQPGLLSLQPSLEEIMASLGDFPDPPTPSKNDGINEPTSMSRESMQSTSLMGPPPEIPRRPPIQQAPPPPPPQPLPLRPTTQDYAAASMLVDYSNQAVAMPTRQSSAITSQMMMMSATSQPQYSNAQYQPIRHQSLNTAWKQSGFLVSLPGTSSTDMDLMNKSLGVSMVNSSDYMPQFLQSPSPSLVNAQNSMVSTFWSSGDSNLQIPPPRSWWLDSTLTASVQSPLSVSTPLSLSNSNGPNTPLGHLFAGYAAGPATPPNILRAMNVDALCGKPSSSLSVINERCSMPTNEALGNSVSVVSKLGSLAQRLEQPSIVRTEKERKIFASTPTRKASDWGLASNHVRSPTNRQETSNSSPSMAWKLASGVDPSALYQQTSAFTAGTAAARGLGLTPTTSRSSLLSHVREDIDDMRNPKVENSLFSSGSESNIMTPSGSVENVEMKEDSMQMSAPSSVKPARGSRQVQADSTLHPEERKRLMHLSAEQNRRTALKDGFDQLMEMIPDLYSGGVKPTNAVVLAKAADHIRRLQATKDSQDLQREEANVRIERFNQKIAALQSNLPASSGPSTSSSQVDSKTSLESFYERFCKEESKKDWRFWVMCRMLQSICVSAQNSFAANVAGEGSSREEISATCSDWLNKHWRAAELRPLASTLLVHLATNTNVLSDPQSLQDHVAQQLKNPL